MMEKNAYLLITDLHLGNILSANRKDYRKELDHVKQHLYEIAFKYKKQGYRVITLFLGDIFNSSYKNVTLALIDGDFITSWRNVFGECYTVMGNHEFTYYRANPFYTEISSVESEKVQAITNKVWKPLGSSNVLKVVDRLEDGEVTFYFNHYNTGIARREREGIAIGLFHQDLVDSQIQKDSERKDRRLSFIKGIPIESTGLLDDYDYCFFGHLHTIYGVWKTEKTYLVYLASLGRPNELEVRDDFLERNVPVVIVDNGKFVGVEDNFIQLLSRSECIFESIANEMHERYLKTVEVREARHYNPLEDEPIENLYHNFIENPRITAILDDLQQNELDRRFLELRSRKESLNA